MKHLSQARCPEDGWRRGENQEGKGMSKHWLGLSRLGERVEQEGNTTRKSIARSRWAIDGARRAVALTVSVLRR